MSRREATEPREATAPEEATVPHWTPSPSQFHDLLKIYGTQLPIRLKGVENFPEWERAVLRRARGLRAMPVLESADEGTEAEIWDMMDLALIELMVNSVAPSLRADIESKTAYEAIETLRGRFAKGGTASYTTIGIKLAQIKQTQDQTVQEYISAFNNLKAQYKAAGGELGTTEATFLINGLLPHYSKEAFHEMSRQGSTELDLESLKQTLIRSSILEKEQKDLRRSRPQGKIEERLRTEEKSETRKDSPKGFRGALTCWHCKRIGHKEEDCWIKHPEKQPKKEDIKSRAYAVREIQEQSIWLLDSAACFYMTPTENNLTNAAPLEEPKRVQIANKQKLDVTAVGSSTLSNGIVLRNVYLVPGLDSSLISIDGLLRDNWKISFEPENMAATVSKQGSSFSVLSSGGVFTVDQFDRMATSPSPTPSVNRKEKKPTEISETLMHKRMGHLNSQSTRLLPEAAGKPLKIKNQRKEV
jgi:gag-polypeptide of LTR copia-type